MWVCVCVWTGVLVCVFVCIRVCFVAKIDEHDTVNFLDSGLKVAKTRFQRFLRGKSMFFKQKNQLTFSVQENTIGGEKSLKSCVVQTFRPVNMCICVNMHIYINMFTCKYVLIYLEIYVLYMHMNVYTYMYIYI